MKAALRFSLLFATFALPQARAQLLNPIGHMSLDQLTGKESLVTEDVVEAALRNPEAKNCAAGFNYTYKRNGENIVKNRGAMPAGYLRGMLVSFARSVCRPVDRSLSPSQDIKSVMIEPSLERADTLKAYQRHPGLLRLNISERNDRHLVNSYSTLMTLGMIESSGSRKGSGIDSTAKKGRGAEEFEAGFFQVSQNSTGFVGRAYQKLKDEYRKDPGRCLAPTFLGAGTGVLNPIPPPGLSVYEDFRQWMLRCPGLAAEYAALLIRKTNNHNGPLKYREVEPKQSCTRLLDSMFDQLHKDANQCEVSFASSDRGSYSTPYSAEHSQYTDKPMGTFVPSTDTPSAPALIENHLGPSSGIQNLLPPPNLMPKLDSTTEDGDVSEVPQTSQNIPAPNAAPLPEMAEKLNSEKAVGDLLVTPVRAPVPIPTIENPTKVTPTVDKLIELNRKKMKSIRRKSSPQNTSKKVSN